MSQHPPRCPRLSVTLDAAQWAVGMVHSVVVCHAPPRDGRIRDELLTDFAGRAVDLWCQADTWFRDDLAGHLGMSPPRREVQRFAYRLFGGCRVIER